MNFKKPPAGGGARGWTRNIPEIAHNWHVFIFIFGRETKEKVEKTVPWWVSRKKYMSSS